MQTLGAASAALAWPAGCARPGGFLTAKERATLAMLADGILPPDDTPGGAALGAVDYVEALVTALDGTPSVLRGGPFSGRQPFPDDSGGPSAQAPANGFFASVPLDRVAAHAWQLRIFGGSGPNDGIVDPIVGLRDQLRQGLASSAGQSITGLDPDFRDLLYQLVSEAAFGAPEYGGNRGGAGWALAHYEGDTAPLGYSWFDATSGQYRERPDAPVSTPNPAADPEPLDDDTRALLDRVIAALGGRTFP